MVHKFSERCNKAQNYLQYLLNLPDPIDEIKVLEIKKQFGLESDFKADRSTDGNDLQIDIKCESYEKSHTEVPECDDHHFDELDDFGEISTIALPDENNFVINNDALEPEENNSTREQSSDETMTKKDEDEVSLE